MPRENRAKIKEKYLGLGLFARIRPREELLSIRVCKPEGDFELLLRRKDFEALRLCAKKYWK